MLPHFPKARKKMRETFFKEVFRAMWDVHPILKEISTRPQTEGMDASYERGDGEIVHMNYQRRSANLQWKPEDAKGLDPEAFLERAKDLGAQMGNKMLEDVIRAASEAAKKVGNVVEVKGAELTFDQFLEITANLHTEFDDNGQPLPKSFLAAPGPCQNLLGQLLEWQADPAKRAALESIIRMQRELYNEREARRRMVD
jgi:hypothetical protein